MFTLRDEKNLLFRKMLQHLRMKRSSRRRKEGGEEEGVEAGDKEEEGRMVRRKTKKVEE